MALRDPKQFMEDLQSQKTTFFVDGEKLEKPYEDPRILPYGRGMAGLQAELQSPPYREMGSVVTSKLINEEVNLFADIHDGPEKWINRTRIQRRINRRRICVFRCLQEDISNGYWAFTYEVDQKHNTEYHKRFAEWVKHMQKTDRLTAGAAICARGDRTKPPHEQPDAYVRVVERKKDGVIIRGCKTSVSMACCVNELLVIPPPIHGRFTPTAEDKDFAIACAIPIDTKGVILIGRLPTKRKQTTDLRMDYPFGRAGVGDAVFMTVFDDVFVPWERVFLCGEWDMLEMGADLGMGTHFGAKGGCKAGLFDLLIGTAALAADVNGTQNTPHTRQKLSILMSWAEEAYAASIGAAVEGKKHPSGTFLPDLLIASSNKWLCSEHGGDDVDILLDLAGGLTTNAPQELQWNSPAVRPYLDKYLVGNKKYTAEERVRAMKLVEDMAASDYAAFLHQSSTNIGGDLMAARSLVFKYFDIEDRKLTAKVIAGLAEKDNTGFTWPR